MLGLASSMMKHCSHSINTEFQWLLKILIALKIKVHLYAMIEMIKNVIIGISCDKGFSVINIKNI